VLLIQDATCGPQAARSWLTGGSASGFRVERVNDLATALPRLRGGRFAAAVADLGLSASDATDALTQLRDAAGDLPVVLIARESERDHLRLGEQDHLVEPRSDAELLRTLHHALERHQMLAELNRAREREHYLATHDSLTTLPNRWCFHDHLSRGLASAARHARQLAVLVLDLDRFKAINDSLGHPVGDELLRQVAARLAAPLRRSDMVARLGSDQFVILLQDVRLEHNPVKVARRILDEFNDPFLLNGRSYRITACLGMAMFPRDGTDPDILIRNADLALYEAKARGFGQYNFYSAHMTAAAVQRLELENSLRLAVEEDQFLFLYQPQIDVEDQRIVGAEALVRWRHPERGLLSPDEFIPAAEEMHLIDVIGQRALLSACEDAARWVVRDGHLVSVAVNVSPQQLSTRGFDAVVARILEATGVGAPQLEIEITESGLMESNAVAAGNLRSLRELGVRVAIDDFGTGYSSMTVLKNLTVDAIKIDQSFIAGLGNSPADEAICTALASMAHGLGLQIVAEGVKTREQIDFLVEHGCTRMQGYFFERPVPSHEVARQLAAGDASWLDALGEKSG
jgi:diguanylate cyclase (GGDEF)-like protein